MARMVANSRRRQADGQAGAARSTADEAWLASEREKNFAAARQTGEVIGRQGGRKVMVELTLSDTQGDRHARQTRFNTLTPSPAY
jgi:hypothetical protein